MYMCYVSLKNIVSSCSSSIGGGLEVLLLITEVLSSQRPMLHKTCNIYVNCDTCLLSHSTGDATSDL